MSVSQKLAAWRAVLAERAAKAIAEQDRRAAEYAAARDAMDAKIGIVRFPALARKAHANE